MIMSSNESYGWSAEHVLPVDGDERQVGYKCIGKKGSIVRHVEFLSVKVLAHANKTRTLLKHVSEILYCHIN